MNPYLYPSNQPCTANTLACNHCEFMSVVRIAQSKDIADIVNITNEAFMADSYFKKPQFVNRTNEGFVEQVLNNGQKEKFLVFEKEGKVLGSVHISWELDTKCGHFGMLSVSTSARKQGIGATLVNGVEEYFLKFFGGPCTITMPVIHSRKDLIPFYEKKGYVCIDTVPFVYPEIIKDGHFVEMFVFEKNLI